MGRGLGQTMVILALSAVLSTQSTGSGDFRLLIFYIVLALGVSFICSILEAVVLSTPQTYVSILQKEKKRTATMWEHLKDDDSVRPLTAILTLNTIAHTMGAAGVGSQVQQIWGIEMLTLASALLTLAVLFLSEILPKTLGTAYWKLLSTPSAYLLTWLTTALFFIIRPIQSIKSILPSKKQAAVTRDDLVALADLGETEGALLLSEETIIHNLLGLRERFVRDEMTPRVVIQAFDISESIRDVLDSNTILRFSRMPVYDESIDDICGLVLRSEILMAASRGEWDVKLEDIMKPISYISINATLEQALDLFLTTRQQFALVEDEFGGTSGILSMEDVIEALLGKEIVDELDEVDDLRKLALEQANQSEE